MYTKPFYDKYDQEFVNLMLSIQSLIENYSKSDLLKINSWAKILCIPTPNIEFKKNRNLYAIKLLDNVLNNKLESPFNKFAKNKELPTLDPILVKVQLSQKFFDYQNFNRIHNINPSQNFFNKTFSNGFKKYKLIPINPNNFNFNNKNFADNNNSRWILKPSGILLQKTFGNENYNFRHKSCLNRYNKNSDLMKENKYNNMADILYEQSMIKNDMIFMQKKEIEDLKRRVSSMEKEIQRMKMYK